MLCFENNNKKHSFIVDKLRKVLKINILQTTNKKRVEKKRISIILYLPKPLLISILFLPNQHIWRSGAARNTALYK